MINNKNKECCFSNWTVIKTIEKEEILCGSGYHDKHFIKFPVFELKRLGEVCQESNRYKIICWTCIKNYHGGLNNFCWGCKSIKQCRTINGQSELYCHDCQNVKSLDQQA